MAEQMSLKEWNDMNVVSKIILERVGFKSANQVRQALGRAGCRIVSPMRPIVIDGEVMG